MLDYQQALTAVLAAVESLSPVQVPLDEGLGKAVSEDLFARRDLPAADNSAMDGYAFAVQGVTAERCLAVTGFLAAGGIHGDRVKPGAAVRIMTGAPLPAGCDSVVPLEEVDILPDNRIRLHAPPVPGTHVRYRGEELRQGEKILCRGQILDAGAIGLLAAAGIARINIHPAPRVAILSTGDELTELDEPCQEGKIINSNAHLLGARLREDGFVPLPLGIAKDLPDDLDRRLRQGLDADLLLTTGGVSVGDRDHVQQALVNLGFEKRFWKVAIKPGKPVLFGMIKQLPVFGLPGNPAACALTYDLFVRPALRILAGHPHPLAPQIEVRLADNVKGGGKRRQFIWGTLQLHSGVPHFHPARHQGSGQNRCLQGAHALLPLAIGAADLAAGDRVEVLMLRLPVEQAPSSH